MKMKSIVATFLSMATGVLAGSKLHLEPGQAAPDFSAPSTSGSTAKLSDFKGQWLVLYFYPKSFTSGCTKEACSLRDGLPNLSKLNAVVLGVSRDDMETQKKFKAEEKLPFDLLADIDKSVAQAYDVIGFGGLYQRRTVIIDPDGKVAHVFYAVNVNAHGEEVADVLKKLQEQKPNPV